MLSLSQVSQASMWSGFPVSQTCAIKLKHLKNWECYPGQTYDIDMCYKTKTSQELRMLPRSDLWYYKKDALYKKVHFSFWWHKCGAFKKTAQCGEFEKIAQCGAFKKIAQCGAFKKIRQCIFAGDCTMCGIHVYDSTRRCAQGDRIRIS